MKAERIGFFIKPVVSPHFPPCLWFYWFCFDESYFDGPWPTCHPTKAIRQRIFHIRNFAWPTVAYRRKRTLKESKANTEIVGKPQEYKLSAMEYIEIFLLLGDVELTFIRFSVTRPVDWPHAYIVYNILYIFSATLGQHSSHNMHISLLLQWASTLPPHVSSMSGLYCSFWFTHEQILGTFRCSTWVSVYQNLKDCQPFFSCYIVLIFSISFQWKSKHTKVFLTSNVIC